MHGRLGDVIDTEQELALVSCPAKTTTPKTRLVFLRLDPRSKMEAGDRGTVCAASVRGGVNSRLPVKVYSEALGCSH